MKKKKQRVVICSFFSFSPSGAYSAPGIFFHSRRWKMLIKNKLCKSSFVLSPVLVCQFAPSVVGCFLFLLCRTWFSVGIFVGCQSTSVHYQVFRFAGWQMVGLFGVSHQVAVSFQNCLFRLLQLPCRLVR